MKPSPICSHTRFSGQWIRLLLSLTLIYTILLTPFAAPLVQAFGPIVVTTTSLADDPSDGACSLREALQTAFLQQVNGVVSQAYHECIAYAGPTTITFGGAAAGGVIKITPPDYPLPMINKEVLIIGPVTISGSGAPAQLPSDKSYDTRLFWLADGGNLTLTALTLKDGYTSGYGGAIFSQQSNTTINLTQVAVIDNQAQGNGGAIYTTGALNILQSSFSGNQALGITPDGVDNSGTGYGGAIAIGGSDKLQVSLTNFSGNVASKGGGAIVNQGSTVLLSDTVFNGNIAKAIGDNQGGGALFNGSNSALSMVRTVFNGNLTPKGSGGALYNNINTAAIISDTVFNGNISGDLATKGQGGAIYNEEDMNITRTSFNANIATKDGLGGAILNNKAAVLKVSNTGFFANVTPEGKGGAIANIDQPYPVSDDSTVEIRNVTFSNNVAQTGSAVYNEEAVGIWNTILEQGAVGSGVLCAGTKPVTDNGHNIQNPGASCGGTMQSTDPKLDLPKPGANFPNVLTMSPKDDSPAVDAGDNAVCTTPPVNKEDQTGGERPVDSNNDGSAICDIGAVETGHGMPGFGADPAQPGPIDFGITTVNTAVDASIDIFDTGKLPLAVKSVSIGGPNANDFQALDNFPIIAIKNGPHQKLKLRCTPSAEGVRTATLTLLTDDVPFHAKVDFDLTCRGTIVKTPGFSSDPLKPGPLDFGAKIINTPVDRVLHLHETGNADLNVAFQSITGDNAGDFKVMSGLPATVLNGDAAGNSVTVRCTPSALGIRTAVLNLTTDDPANANVSFDLTCTGNPAPVPFLAAPGVSTTGLNGAYGLAISPDNKQVYVTNYFAGTLSHFDRALTNGQLTLQGTYSANETKGARKVAISPDGKQLYVTASTGNALVIYTRNPNTGQLVLKDKYTDNVVVKGLNGAHGVAVSPDGKNIYVASVNEDGLVTFSRDQDDFVGYQDAILSAQDLNGAHGVAVSPDGKNVYVTSYTSSITGTLAVYTRNLANGSLTHAETWREGQLITFIPLRFLNGLAGAHAVTVSGDGAYVYVAGLYDNALTVFKRNLLTGKLAYLATYKDGVNGMDALGQITAATISPDGNHLFTTAITEKGLGVFDRDPSTGLVSFVEAIKRDSNTGLPKLDSVNDVAITSDGSTVYAVSGIDNAIVAFAVANPKATLESLLPASVQQGASNFTLVIKGKNFVGGSQVQWNESNRPTTYVSTSELHAEIGAADVAAAGSVPINVVNPAPGGGDANNQKSFTITAPGDNPAPSIDFINPQSVPADVQQFTLSVHGANFVQGAKVRMNGADRPTVFVNSTELQATIGAADVAAVAAMLANEANEVSAAAVDANQPAGITVVNPPPGGGASNAVLFTVLEAGQNPAPAVTQLQPATLVEQGAAATQLTVHVLGSNFMDGSQAFWNGAQRPTKLISDSELEMTLLAGDIGTAGVGGITVQNPTPGGGESNVINFTVTAVPQNATPTLTQLAPAFTLAHGAASVPVVVTLVGSNFMPSSQAFWNGVFRPTKFIDGAKLEVTLAAADVTAGGTGALTVINPPPGGGASADLAFTVFGYGAYLPLAKR
ncbi:MAG: beta-propeller fold lactonase family protein [Caldilineaceae bacterium]